MCCYRARVICFLWKRPIAQRLPSLQTKNTWLDVGFLQNKWSIHPPSGVVSWLRDVGLWLYCSQAAPCHDSNLRGDGLCVCVCSRQGTTGKRPGKARVIHSQGSTAVKGVTTVMENTCCQMLKGMPSSPKHTNTHKHSPNIFWSYMLPCRSASTLVGCHVSRKKPAAGCDAISCLLRLIENWWAFYFLSS